MLIDPAAFPFVHFHYDRDPPAGADDAFAIYERLLSRDTRFVLVGHGASDHAADHDQEERKQVALWMKRNREALRRLVAGMVQIEPQAANRFVARQGADTYEKFWGYPMLVASDEPHALAAAAALLAGVAACAVDVGEDVHTARP